VFKVLELIDPVFRDKEKHLSYGFVQLKQGKMSSRMGNVVSGEWLLDEAKARIQKEFKDMDDNTAEAVAVGAVKYSMLKFTRESNIKFSFEDSINLEGNSGPYLQYTFARTQSVVRKSQISNLKSQISNKFQISNFKLESEEVLLLRAMYRFPEVVEEAGEKFSPNILCNYLFDLCQKFNIFYQKLPIINPGVIETQEFRLGLTMAVGQIIKNGLYLLGIAAPERM
jgi:arginyl-tRNA synthetase